MRRFWFMVRRLDWKFFLAILVLMVGTLVALRYLR